MFTPSIGDGWKAWRLLAVALLGGLLLLFIRPSGAAEFGERDARAVQAVVQAQLSAFADDDAEKAFSHATPAIRARFGNAAGFMAMVQAGYPMVIKPATVAFFVATELDGDAIQKVHLRDADGARWLAVYQLQRDGSTWRIAGVAVEAESGQSRFL